MKQRIGGKLNSWPDRLTEILVSSLSKPNDLICDPFAGTGRPLSVVGRLGRKGIGYEIDETLQNTIRENLMDQSFIGTDDGFDIGD